MCIEKIAHDNWEALEDKNFADIQCIRAIISSAKKVYRVIGPHGTMTALDKKTKGPKTIEIVVGNPRTYLAEAEHPLIPYGYWTCSCEREWVHTPFTNQCPICGCSISNNTSKAKYIEEIEL